MSITELISAARALPHEEKRQLTQTLLEDLAHEVPEVTFQEGQVYHIYTPEFGPGAVEKLAQVLDEYKKSQ